MKLTKNLGMLLLSIWLILTGLIALTNFSFHGIPLIMGIFAIAAGVLILLGR
jgi:hypothetical protein